MAITLGTQLFREVFLQSDFFGLGWITIAIIILLSLVLITRDFTQWKTLAFPVSTMWFISGVRTGGYADQAILIITGIIFAITTFSTQAISEAIQTIHHKKGTTLGTTAEERKIIKQVSQDRYTKQQELIQGAKQKLLSATTPEEYQKAQAELRSARASQKTLDQTEFNLLGMNKKQRLQRQAEIANTLALNDSTKLAQRTETHKKRQIQGEFIEGMKLENQAFDQAEKMTRRRKAQQELQNETLLNARQRITDARKRQEQNIKEGEEFIHKIAGSPLGPIRKFTKEISGASQQPKNITPRPILNRLQGLKVKPWKKAETPIDQLTSTERANLRRKKLLEELPWKRE